MATSGELAVAPFAFDALPAVSRDELRAAAALRAASADVRLAAVAAALTELVGESVELRVRRTRTLHAASPTDGLTVAFAFGGSDVLAESAFVDVERALTVSLVARALRQRAPRIVEASQPLGAEIAGALAAVLCAALRRVQTTTPPRVLATGPSPTLARELVAAHGTTAAAWLTVLIGGEAFDARLGVPNAWLNAPAPAEWTRSKLRSLGELPIALPLVAARCLADRATLESLRPGDALVVPDLFAGPVALVPPAGERGLSAHLDDEGSLVLASTPLSSHLWDQDIQDAMPPETSTLEVIEQAPVVVRVELGAVEMTAREWAALEPGDAIALGRKLGAPVILRVAGVEVARGELVQIDGEYGVRILSRPSASEKP